MITRDNLEDILKAATAPPQPGEEMAYIPCATVTMAVHFFKAGFNILVHPSIFDEVKRRLQEP